MREIDTTSCPVSAKTLAAEKADVLHLAGSPVCGQTVGPLQMVSASMMEKTGDEKP